MADSHADWSQPAMFDAQHLSRLIASLRALGYAVFGPRVRDGPWSSRRSSRPRCCPPAGRTDRSVAAITLTRTGSPRLFG